MPSNVCARLVARILSQALKGLGNNNCHLDGRLDLTRIQMRLKSRSQVLVRPSRSDFGEQGADLVGRERRVTRNVFDVVCRRRSDVLVSEEAFRGNK